MKITRKIEIETTDVRVGDQIQVGKYTATCQAIPGPGLGLFLLDQYLDQGMAYNRNGKNAGGYAASDVRRDLNAPEILEIFAALPLVPHENGDLLRLATYGEMFGHDEWYKSGAVEPDNDEQWPLMADRRNRIADREGEPYEWGWLQNICVQSAAGACYVRDNGAAYAWNASTVIGVRPAFIVKLS